ncbi:MAG: M15 family metallopeptidase, partial [Myxococcota bacterium]
WDTLSEASHTWKAKGDALANRLVLREAMHAEGFKNYFREWWHYTYGNDKALKHRDVPYACFEPGEGAWTPPDGWDAPGYVMPATWTVADCG